MLKCLMLPITRLSIGFLTLALAGSLHAEWKNCKYTRTEQKEVFDTFFDYFITVDPRSGVMLDPKCDINVLCRNTSTGSEADFSADCRLLKAEGNDVSKMPPTGESYKFSKTIVKPNGKKPYLRE